MSCKKVMIGMSGGVDSSVAAALLMESGYDVYGATMKVWNDVQYSSVDDARKVAEILGIPHSEVDFKGIFREKVIESFIEDYFGGRTPNPCILCNKYIKFDAMLEWAVSFGMDYIATGHYASISYDDINKRYIVRKAADKKKDQTYVLYNLTQQQLSHVLMPLGTYQKEQIRNIAERIGVDFILKKPESQDICFIEDNNHGRYLEDNSENKVIPGDFVDMNGNVLGRHKGIIYYTIGQRKGLGISLGKPAFVVDIDIDANRVILGNESDLYTDSLTAYNINYVSIEKPDSETRVTAKIRYYAPEAPATLYPLKNNRIQLVFDKPQRAITPGQSVVFYEDDLLVGGGIIEK
jgi:tRNA-uridine 2-sulfurtransferase